MGASTLIATGFYPGSAIATILLAGFLSGGGGGIAAFLYWSSHEWPLQIRQNGDALAWQYSLRDLFLRFTVLSLLIAAWSLAIALVMNGSSP
jgi:hypothetical protein